MRGGQSKCIKLGSPILRRYASEGITSKVLGNNSQSSGQVDYHGAEVESDKGMALIFEVKIE